MCMCGCVGVGGGRERDVMIAVQSRDSQPTTIRSCLPKSGSRSLSEWVTRGEVNPHPSIVYVE